MRFEEALRREVVVWEGRKISHFNGGFGGDFGGGATLR